MGDRRGQNRNLWKKRPRQQGGHPLEDTATLPAGTSVAYTDAAGHERQLTLEYDTVLPADCVDEDGATIHGADWEYWEDDWEYE